VARQVESTVNFAGLSAERVQGSRTGCDINPIAELSRRGHERTTQRARPEPQALCTIERSYGPVATSEKDTLLIDGRARQHAVRHRAAPEFVSARRIQTHERPRWTFIGTLKSPIPEAEKDLVAVHDRRSPCRQVDRHAPDDLHVVRIQTK